MDQQCLVCKRTNILDSNFKAIDDEVAPSSGKILKTVLRHVLKCTQVELEISEDSSLCSKCYKFIIEYDEHVVKLMNLQKRFKIIYNNPINLSQITTRSQTQKSQISSSDEMNVDEDEFIAEAEEIVDISSDEELSEDSGDSQTHMDMSTQPVQCKYCLEYFKNMGQLRKHVSDVHVKKECFCNICGISVKDEEYLELHMNIHDGKTEYDCRYCPKRFTHKSSVIRHMHKHWDKKKYQCEKCGLRFSETPRLYNHKLLHEAEENPLICHICNQNCKTRRTYKRHMNTHREDRPRYPCHICGKTFSEKFTLKPHLRTHEGYTDKNIKIEETIPSPTPATNELTSTIICIICGNVFNMREQYNKHMQEEHDVVSWET